MAEPLLWNLLCTILLPPPSLSDAISDYPHKIEYHSLHLELTYKPDPTSNPPKQIQWAPSAGTGAPPKWLPTPPVHSGTHGWHQCPQSGSTEGVKLAYEHFHNSYSWALEPDSPKAAPQTNSHRLSHNRRENRANTQDTPGGPGSSD